MTINEFVKKYDPENQFDVLKNSYRQIEFAWGNEYNLSRIETAKIKNIIVTGLGGSAIAGDLLRNFLGSELKIPYQVNRGYSLPAYVNESSLVIASSYSGNTEETLSAFDDAQKKKAQIIVVATGGTIGKLACDRNFSLVKLQTGFQPRYALGLSFFTLLKIFQTLKLVSNHDALVNFVIHDWKKLAEEFSVEDNSAFQTAARIIGTLPVIYSDGNLNDSIGGRFKAQLNENSKLHAFCNTFPELNHNEIIGWETADQSGIRYSAIFIHDADSHPQVKKRFQLTAELVAKSGAEIISLSSEKKNLKERLLQLVYSVDWISYFAAILRKKDPSEIDYIHLLKNKLTE